MISDHRPQLLRCVSDNPLPAGAAKANVKVKVIVAPTGRPKTVAFEQGALDGTSAGGCIKSTLSAVTFPRAKEERTVTFRLTL